MKKIALILIAVFTAVAGFSQTLADGIKQLNYQRYDVAKQTLEAVYNAAKQDPNAVYWYGQAILEESGNSPAGIAAARALYQTALNGGVNDPLILAGVGQTFLLEKKNAEATQSFEQAKTTALAPKKDKNKRADVLVAIGRANAAGGSDIGNAQYGIDILTQAEALDKTNADIDIIKGILYSKMGSDFGGKAVESFRNALVKDPNNVIANYRIGNVYYTQKNVAAFTDAYNKAASLDPSFTLGYIKMINYYERRDVNKANELIQTLIKNSPDKGCDLDFYQANYLFLSGKYQESLDKAVAMQQGACANHPYLNSLFAYNYDRLGDSVKSKQYIETFINNAKPDVVTPDQYVFAAGVLLKFPGNEVTASNYLEKALAGDTVKANQITYLKDASEALEKAGNYEAAYTFYSKLPALKGETTEFDYYKLTELSINTSNLMRTDSIASAYITAHPDKPQGYSFRVRNAKGIDTTLTPGFAIPVIEQQNAYYATDSVANKDRLYANYYYMLIYYVEKEKNYEKGINMAKSIMNLYPAGDPKHEFGKSTAAQLQKALDAFKKQGGTTGSSTSKPKAKTSGK